MTRSLGFWLDFFVSQLSPIAPTSSSNSRDVHHPRVVFVLCSIKFNRYMMRYIVQEPLIEMGLSRQMKGPFGERWVRVPKDEKLFFRASFWNWKPQIFFLLPMGTCGATQKENTIKGPFFPSRSCIGTRGKMEKRVLKFHLHYVIPFVFKWP